jgi:ABC-type transport system involved in cytochrome bd biosynthesis fused ATPase/permease subunit
VGIFVITHEIADPSNFDRVLELREGRVLDRGTQAG